jgi:transcription-repair coupling factor (superfamily II helicase)
MYMQLLEQTIRELKGEELEDDRRAAVNLKLSFRIEDSYIPDMNQRLSAYRRMASARTPAEIETLVAELADRYGPPPPSVAHLAEYARLRLAADRLGLDSVDREGSTVVLKFRPDAKLDPAWLMNLIRQRGDLTLLPPAVLRLDLDGQARPRPAATVSGRPAGRLVAKDEPPTRESWWTTRATSQVAPGFTREEILAEAPPDPSAPGGLFERLGALFEQLSKGLVT